jgi:hypothetical protein
MAVVVGGRTAEHESRRLNPLVRSAIEVIFDVQVHWNNNAVRIQADLKCGAMPVVMGTEPVTGHLRIVPAVIAFLHQQIAAEK